MGTSNNYLRDPIAPLRETRFVALTSSPSPRDRGGVGALHLRRSLRLFGVR